jgi:hypothetical protein
MLYNKLLIVWLVTGCSAVFFGRDDQFAYVASAAHCVRGETTDAEIDGKRVGIRWVHVDREHDIAIGKAFAHAVPTQPGSITQAKTGPATVIGYPAGIPTVKHADIPGHEATIDGSPKTILATAPPIVGGTSGGAVVQDGNLVGIVTHSTPAGGACTTTNDIYRATNNSGISLDPTTYSQRDIIIATIAAIASYFFKDYREKHTDTRAPPSPPTK